MGILDVKSPTIFWRLSETTIGARTRYPVVDAAVAAQVLGPVDSVFIGSLGQDGTLPLTYLDNGATALMLPTAEAALRRFLQHYGNTHTRHHNPARFADYTYRKSRDIVSRFVGADPGRHVVLFIGQGTTDAINHLARTLFEGKENPRDTVIIIGDAHHANILPWLTNAPKVVPVPIEDAEWGTFPLEALREALRANAGKVRVVSITGVSNVTGIIPNIREIAEIVHAEGAMLNVDGAHLLTHGMGATVPGIGFISMQAMGIDSLTGSGHKVDAPGSPGVLVMPISISPMVPARVGGGIVEWVTLLQAAITTALPEREEAGTPLIVGAAILASSLSTLSAIGVQRNWEHEQALTARAIHGLKQIPGVTIYGDTDIERTPRAGVITLNVSGIPHPIVSAALSDYFNIATRNGCFCAQPYVKVLLGITDAEERQIASDMERGYRSKVPGMVRPAFAAYTIEEDVERLLAALKWLVENKSRVLAEYVIDDHGEAVRRDGWTVDPDDYLILPEVLGDLLLVPDADRPNPEDEMKLFAAWRHRKKFDEIMQDPFVDDRLDEAVDFLGKAVSELKECQLPEGKRLYAEWESLLSELKEMGRQINLLVRSATFFGEDLVTDESEMATAEEQSARGIMVIAQRLAQEFHFYFLGHRIAHLAQDLAERARIRTFDDAALRLKIEGTYEALTRLHQRFHYEFAEGDALTLADMRRHHLNADFHLKGHLSSRVAKTAFSPTDLERAVFGDETAVFQTPEMLQSARSQLLEIWMGKDHAQILQMGLPLALAHRRLSEAYRQSRNGEGELAAMIAALTALRMVEFANTELGVTSGSTPIDNTPLRALIEEWRGKKRKLDQTVTLSRAEEFPVIARRERGGRPAGRLTGARIVGNVLSQGTTPSPKERKKGRKVSRPMGLGRTVRGSPSSRRALASKVPGK
ncbi:MAG: aminotransferase class V-fold PLP-dependent enzyme [Deltaproteobacteria bacterium]|nr:aminotransferase class V-fold PLP-dependent enzyme [Deltaproteobacteria bacterium]